jgi:hypothetical protein
MNLLKTAFLAFLLNIPIYIAIYYRTLASLVSCIVILSLFSLYIYMLED